ncbi:hypothetical protein VUR80DRAFT_7881 [Thermomyces stellatus]
MENMDNVPGTVYLVDQSGGGDGGSKDIILVPQPSSDPEDPLNWSLSRKLRAVSMVYLFIIGNGIATSLQYSVLADITRDTGISTAHLVQGNGIMILFFGWACLFWQPIALTFGRRGVYLASTLLMVPLCEWTAHSKTAGEWYAHRILIGFAASPFESLGAVTVFDLFFAHNRGTYMGAYVFILFGGTFLAPLIAGWFNDAYGWRWTMHLGAIVSAGIFVILFFGLEETMYFRGATGPRADPLPVTSSDSRSSDDDDSASGNRKTDDAKKSAPVANNEPALARASSNPTAVNRVSPVLLTWNRLKPFRSLPGRPTVTDMFRMAYRPVLMIFTFPCTAWSGFLYGNNLAWYNVLNGTASPILSSEPYNWKAASIGSVYAGPIIGSALACVWSGVVADKFTLWLARRNNGIREAEQRLWALAVSTVLTAAGLITWGVGAYHHVHWVGLVFGLGMLTFGVVTGGSIAVAYNVDCFKDLAGETTVSIMIIRNTIGFGFNYAITPWYENQGLQNCFITAAFLSIGCTLTFLPIMVYGKRMRIYTAKIAKKWLNSSVAGVMNQE